MSDGMGREPAYLSSHATNRYFIPNWGQDTKKTKEELFCENEEQLKQLSNRDERVVQNNEKPKENKVVRRSFL